MILWRRLKVQVDKVISKSDLMILLNEIYLSESRVFKIKYPFYDISLFKVDLGKYLLRNIVTEEKFNTQRNENVPESDFLRGDLPRFTDFRDCLITSAFLPFSNFSGVRERLLDLANTIKSPSGRSKPLYLALDTNLVYLKFFSRYFPIQYPELERILDISDFRIALSDTVKEEIDANIKHKYRASNLNKMKKKFGHSRIVDEFFNCSAKKTRVAKSAQNEIKLLMGDFEAERAESNVFSEDKEERDRVIAKSYSSFESAHGGEVLLLTADEDMAYHAKNAGLLDETLLIPHEVPEKGYILPYQLVNLIYDLAISFGVIGLGGCGVTIFGEWKGKNFNNYSMEQLKLKIQSKSRIREDFDRDLRIAQKIDGTKL
jgi:hypothetical protein